jgi:hypothetical protein
MLKKTLFAAALLSAVYVGCKGPAGPPGDAESLSDPSVQPKVIYTYPPANSLGPYPELGYSNRIQVRFNKFMDPTSVKRAIKLSSPTRNIRNDTSSFASIGGDLFYAYIVDSSGYGFEGWKTYTTYTLSIASSAKDINGNRLLPPYSMTFAPEPFFRIRSVYPADGATDVSGTAGTILDFNSPVDSTIFASVQISPSAAGKWSFYYYPDSTSISYNAFLNSNTTYKITVGTSAHDKYGHHPPQQFTSSFTTSPFRVSGTSPYDGSTHNWLNNKIYVFFTASIDTQSARWAFRITPPTAGYFVPATLPTATFVFVPSNGLLGSTMYTVTIDTMIRSSIGDRLSAPFTFSFTTGPFEVIDSDPGGWVAVSRYASVVVYANGDVDTGSVRSAFSMQTSSGAFVDGTFSMYEGSDSFVFIPLNLPLSANATYTVTISTALRSKSGSNLESPYTFSFTTGN